MFLAWATKTERLVASVHDLAGHSDSGNLDYQQAGDDRGIRQQ